MHVLLTVNAAWNIWNFRMPVVRFLLAQGHKVSILAPSDNTVPLLQQTGCQFIPLEMSAKGLSPLDSLKQLVMLRRIFKQENPDIVLSYTIKNNIFGAFAAKMCGVPFVPNISGLGTAFLSSGLLQTVASNLYKAAFRGLPTVFFQNHDDKQLFLNLRLISDGQAKVLPGSGVDLEHYLPAEYPASDSAIVFLMIARLLKDKGTLEFVDAARQVKKKHPQIRFQLLGAADSDNRTAVSSNTVNGWVSDGVIEYLGTTTDVRPHIADANCVVLPSYREGAPRTLIEAAAMARPLISTDVPGCRSVVDDNMTGLLCESKNSKALANVMFRFLEMAPEEQSDMGKLARKKMEEEYSQDIIVSAYADVIKQLA